MFATPQGSAKPDATLAGRVSGSLPRRYWTGIPKCRYARFQRRLLSARPPSDRQGDTRSALGCTVTLRLDVDDRSAEVSFVVTSRGTWIVVVVDVDRPWPIVEVPHDMRRLRETACAIVAKLDVCCR